LALVEAEAVRPGLPGAVNVEVASSSPAVGTITTSPLAFNANVTSQTTQFDPQAAGVTTISVTTPTRFDTSNNLRCR